jgi:hypothetical protein
MINPPFEYDLNKAVTTKADLLERAVALVGMLSAENKKLKAVSFTKLNSLDFCRD